MNLSQIWVLSRGLSLISASAVPHSVCVCVCVRERERESVQHLNVFNVSPLMFVPGEPLLCG